MPEQMVVSENMLKSLSATRPWVIFLAILGFIFTGLLVITGFSTSFLISAIAEKQGLPHFFGLLLGIFYLAFGIFFYLIPCLFLLRYGQAIGRISTLGQEAIEKALTQQKSFWKYMGIFAIVMIVLYVVLMIGMFAAVMFGVMHHA